MAKSFSVSVNIGGRLLPSLAGAVAGAKREVRSLETVFATAAARINAPFVAAQKHIDAFSKRMEKVQRTGRNLTVGVTAPTGFAAATMFRGAVERDKAENNLEALGGISPAERREVSAYADSIAAKYGRATGILKTFNEMLKAGFSVPAAKGSIASILEGSIVADGEMSAADLAGAVSKIVTQYGLGMKTVEDAAASSRRITDNLIYGANSTAANIREMTDAFKFVGAAASAAGESIESTNALIIGLSKAGQMGSEAGVALRSAYVRLLKPTNAGRATMARLGLDYGDYVSGGKRTGAGVASGLGAYGYNVPASDLDKALARNKGSADKQRKAVFDAVVAHLGADQAKDIEAIGKAVDGALTLSGSKVDLTGLMGALKKAGATQGDLANIFEGRQSVRMLSLLKADLQNILKEVNEGAAGYSEKTVAKRQQGLEGATRRLDAAWQTFSNTLVKAVTPEIVGMMERFGRTVNDLSASSPGMLRTGIALTAAAAAAGPLLFVLGSVGRVATLAFSGVVGAAGLMAVGVTKAFTGIAAASALAAKRIRAFAAGAMLLGAVGGRGAILTAMGAGLLSFGKAVLLFPVTALRAIGAAMWMLIANPVGIAVALLVGALAALGVWVYNNWNGIKEFFAAFGKGFMEGLGPAAGVVSKMADSLGSVVGWLGNLLGPIDESGAKWRSWGEAVGGVAAKGVNAVIDGIQRLIGFMSTVIEKASQVGSAIANMWRGGGGGVATGAAKSPFVANSIAGARAKGGPVTRGRSYLVGENGPEILTPGFSGNIHTNDTLRKLTADGAAAVAGSTTNTTHGPVTITNNWTINGADNPDAVVRQIDSRFGELLAQMEREQSGLLSD